MAIASSMRNMVLVLVGVGLLAALGLGGMSVLTKEPIEAAKREKEVQALREVLPPFDNDPSSQQREVEVEGGALTVYPAMKDGVQVGTAVRSFSNAGFGGSIAVMVGFDSVGNITGYSVLEQAETPGLGDKMIDWFKPQGEPEVSLVERIFGFRMPVTERKSNIMGLNPGEAPLAVSKDGGRIDAITAATVSSRAFLDAVNRAYQGYDVEAEAITGATQQNNEEGGKQ